jgi:hypothetical protein
MKKIITTTITGIIFGVIIFGSGCVVSLEPNYIKNAQENGIIYLSIDNNASFLAPTPINIVINSTYDNQYYFDPLLAFRNNILLDKT